ncbi:MAG: hypothetical protein KUF72_02140 [Candidatus Thiodiazotropha sp. (ex Ctena orbiculata)]|nr:hypothetical protein [Candidatus Thiodiazotropha taylori]
MQRLPCCLVALLLLVITGGLVYKFILQGDTAPANDGRLVILMPEEERDLVLAEMRSFLASVRSVAAAIEKDDADALAKAARLSGMSAGREMPGSLVGRLPMEFKRLGFDTHRRFDQMALDAEQMGDMQLSLQQLTQVLDNCVSCHATYRIDRMAE